MLEEAQQATDEDDAFVKRMLLQQLGVIRLVANTPTAQNQALLRRLAELGNDQVPVEELIVWEDLYPIIDRLYNRFHTRLKERYGSLLTDKEMQTCCLLCAGFSTKEIGVITHQSDSSIYVHKTSIRRKLEMPEGADIVGFVNEG
jgi:DNA-binding CsgD family transcriptional regulator